MILSENTTLTGNGIGTLTDAVSAIVTHEINGQFELMMTYPVTGIHYSELAQNRIIWAEPDNMSAQQAFRIYRITRPLNGIVTVYARHIAYDMSGIIAEPYTATSLQTALSGLASHCVPSCPFTFTTARAVASPFKVSQPTALWSLLGGQAGSFLDVYGGEWAFDNYAATLTSHLGADRGVSVRYGKNLTELEQDLTIEATYVGIYPFWYDEETDTLVTLPEKYISTTGTGSRILILDCSGDFENQPTVAQLRTRAQSYITANSIGEPQISWKVSFAQLAQDPQYADIAALEQVQLGDTIHIFYEPMDLEASSRAVKIEYDVLMKRYRSVTLGRVKQNLAAIVAGTSQEIQKAVSASRTAIDRAIENSTEFIKNGTGYMRFIYNDAGDLMEIVSLDNPDINQAQKVWRWNNGGFGFSSTGYSGPYTTAITQDGSIVADFITTGTLNAARIKAGILEDEAGKFSLNMVTGELHVEQIDLVAEKLDNMGGRNYAWAISADYHTPTTLSYVTSTYNPDNNGEYVVTATRAGASDQNSPQTYTKKYPVPSELLGTECIFHVDAIERSNSATIPQVGLLLYDSSDTQFFTRYLQIDTMSRVVTIPTNAATMRIDIFVDANKVNAVGDYATVRGIKLERGTVATDWTPAPEDQAGYADHTASAQIVVATNNIISTVSETYETKEDAETVNLMPNVYYREALSGAVWESNGITWTVNPDGSLTATGTATGNTTYSIANSQLDASVPAIRVDQTKQYTISGTPQVTGCRLYYAKRDASGTIIGNEGYIMSAASAAIPAGASYISTYAYIVSGTALPEGGVTFKPQLEEGTTAHRYVPTHGGSYAYQSQIVQNATEISHKVSTTDYNGRIIASLINQTATDASINAQKINLTGYVTASSLTASGTTTIDGSRITTGHIDADRIKVEDLQALGATIAGWTIGTTELSKSWSGSLLTHKAGINAPATPSTSDAAFYVSATVGSATTYPFRVNYDGKLIATSAEIEGTITSSNATITGGTINITTSDATTDVITLKYGSNSVTVRPGQIVLEGSTTYARLLTGLGSLTLSNIPSGSTTADSSAYLTKLGTLELTTSAGKTDLTPTGLTFYNSSGTVAAQYPADNSTIRKASTGSATTMTTGTATRMVSIVLDPGVWLMCYTQSFGNNATGYRTIYLTTNASSTSISQALHAAATTAAPASGATSYVNLASTTRVTAQTTVYGYAIQTSGGNLNGTGYINAVRIA